MPEVSIEGEDHVAGTGGLGTCCYHEHLYPHCIVVRGFGLWTGAEARQLLFSVFGLAHKPGGGFIEQEYVYNGKFDAPCPVTLGECASLNSLYWGLGLEWQRNNIFTEYDVGYTNWEGNAFLESDVCTDLRWGRERRYYGGRELECEGLDPTA